MVLEQREDDRGNRQNNFVMPQKTAIKAKMEKRKKKKGPLLTPPQKKKKEKKVKKGPCYF